MKNIAKNNLESSGAKALAFGEIDKCEIMKYPAIFFEDGEYVGVEFPDLPGCYSQGKDLAEAETNASKALTDFLNAYETVPEATDLSAVQRKADTLAIQFVEVAPSGEDTHELFYNEELNRLVTFPKNQELLGSKLSEKIKLAAGAA